MHSFGRALFTACLLSWATACSSERVEGSPEPASASGFHLLLITLDTTRADHLGCYGYEEAQTITIDELADRGVRFVHAVTSAPLTLPAHSTLMTGRIPPRHGVRDNGSFRLADEQETLGEVLGRAGYRTAAFVASFVLDARYGLDQGFDLYDDEVNPLEHVAEGGVLNERPADQVTDAALAWMQEGFGSDAPAFLWVHYFDPHAPYTPPKAYRHPFEATPYDGEVAFIDAQIERLIVQLRRSGQLESTLIVVTADHGEGLGEHEEYTHSRQIYDSTMRIPLILSNPVLFPEAVVAADRVVGLVDVFPTVLSLLGIPATDRAVDGRDLFAKPDPERAVYMETLSGYFLSGWAPLYGARRVDWKYIAAPRPELYDLRADSGELQSLHERERSLSRELECHLTAILGDLGAGVDAGRKIGADEEGRLAELGYVHTLPAGGDDLPDPKDEMRTYNDVNRAMSLSLEGRPEEALALIGDVLAERPGNANAWRIAYYIHNRIEQWDEAEAAVRRQIALAPTAGGFVTLARLLLRRGKTGGFLHFIDKAEALDPEEGLVYMARGDYMALAGKRDEAIRFYEIAIEKDPARARGEAEHKIEELRKRP